MQEKALLTVENILENVGFEALNEMQEASILTNEEQDEVILLSATGSGKTLGFLIPAYYKMKPEVKHTQALIIVPSRELALQIEQTFKLMRTGYKVTTCYGGHKREIEENNLIDAPALIIGTPGRLCDHIRRGNIKTEGIEMLILDEFDKSLELGFLEEVSFIYDNLPNVTKKLLTSATEAVEIPEFLQLENATKLNFIKEDDTTKALVLQKIYSFDSDKINTCFNLICSLGNRSMIIFCNHRESVERTSFLLWERGIVNEYYHGAMEQRERETALSKFRNGSTNILVTTDLAARGLDIPNIRYIIHYHLPSTPETFTHRNGRTARMDASGTSIMILGPDERQPDYITDEVEKITITETHQIPDKPKWVTFYLPLGKKNKVNKMDIVGFFTKIGQLKMEDLGLIESKDFNTFVAVRRSKATGVFNLLSDQSIKGKKAKVEIAKLQFNKRD